MTRYRFDPGRMRARKHFATGISDWTTYFSSTPRIGALRKSPSLIGRGCAAVRDCGTSVTWFVRDWNRISAGLAKPTSCLRIVKPLLKTGLRLFDGSGLGGLPRVDVDAPAETRSRIRKLCRSERSTPQAKGGPEPSRSLCRSRSLQPGHDLMARTSGQGDT